MLQLTCRICRDRRVTKATSHVGTVRSIAAGLTLSPARGASSTVEDQSDSPTGAPAGQSQPPLELKKAQRRLKQQQNLQASHLSDLRKQWASEHSSMLLKRQQAHQELRKQNQARSLAQEGKRSKDAAKGQIAMKAAQHVVAQRKAVYQLSSAHRRRAREQIYTLSDHDKRQWLEEQSRNWIAANQLDQRIEWALDNPQQLGGTVNSFAQTIAASEPPARQK